MEIEQLGPYRLLRKLGRGGMGTVYQGVNIETGEAAAVKMLAASLAGEEGFRERFETEIETLRKLNHHNIVRLFGFGEQGPHLFYAMELVEGPTLEEELQKGRHYDWREVTRITIEICRALRHAHDRGVVHRDLKPANLLVAKDGSIKLSDFGIARLFGSTRMTSAGSVLGTAEYMAPEQVEGRAVGPRSDLYSLGGVMFALLARRPPFRAKSLPEMLHMQRYAKPDPVRRYAKDAPKEMEDIIAQLLEKDPDKRIPNPTILMRRLEAMLHGLSVLEQADNAAGAGFDLSEPDPRLALLPVTRADDDPPPQAPTSARPEVALGSLDVTQGGFELAPADREQASRPKIPQTVAAAPGEGTASLPFPGADRTAPGKFVVVGDKPEDESLSEPRSALVSPHTWALVISLVAVGLSIWYFLQPPSADVLYNRIRARGREGSLQALLRAEGDIQEFLMQYPGDPRCRQLLQYREDLDLIKLERRFSRRAREEDTAGLLPIELGYLEAMQTLRVNADRGATQLRALICLYDNGDTSGPTGQTIELARRQLAKVEKQLSSQAEIHRGLLRTRLAHARELSRVDLPQARNMWEAVIELYAEKEWAAEQVAEARERLAATAEKAAALAQRNPPATTSPRPTGAAVKDDP